MNYAQKVLFGKLRELQDGRRRFNYFAATSEEKHWDNEFALIKAIKILSGNTVKRKKVCIDPFYINCGYHYDRTGCMGCPKFGYKPE
jgi:hypothetical protein